MKSDKLLKGITVFAVVVFCFTLNASAAWRKKKKKVTEETKTEAVVSVVQETAPAPAQVATPPRAVILPPGFNPNPPANVGKPITNPANVSLPPGFNPPGYSGALAVPATGAAEPKTVKAEENEEESVAAEPVVEAPADIAEEDTDTDYGQDAEETDEYTAEPVAAEDEEKEE